MYEWIEGMLKPIEFVIGIAITYVICHLLNRFLLKYFKKLVEREPKFETSYAYLRRIVIALVALVSVTVLVFSVFPEAGAAVASILVAAGFASIVVGMAAQSTLSNLIAGMVIATSQPFRVNDAVLLRGEFGFVEDVTLTYTVVRTWDNRRLIIPNSVMQGEVFVNYSIRDPKKLVPVYVKISYESDIDRAVEIMKELARKHPDFLPLPGLPVVHVMELTESGISLRLLSAAKDQPTAFEMSKSLLYQIRKEFERNGIEIPYQKVSLVIDPELRDAILKLSKSLA
ncbi:MAG: mechanosensitive ion channel family protein [Thaumarchaeota archaeon]|nr:mechanosensitive ion channel family protein [Nitrososphaerota archaeon]